MAREQVIDRPDIEGEAELTKEVITSRLISIVNAETSKLEDLDQLSSWMSQHSVFETFKAAISRYGRPRKLDYYFDKPGCLSEAICEELEIGEDGEESRLFQARLLNLPNSTGPAIHIYARDGLIPTFGVLLPFSENGLLDQSRSISGGHYLAAGTHAFNPPREPVTDDDGSVLSFSHEKLSYSDDQTATVIAYATAMSAAQLAFYLEKVQPVKEEAPPPIGRVGPDAVRCSRLVSTIGRLRTPL